MESSQDLFETVDGYLEDCYIPSGYEEELAVVTNLINILVLPKGSGDEEEYLLESFESVLEDIIGEFEESEEFEKKDSFLNLLLKQFSKKVTKKHKRSIAFIEDTMLNFDPYSAIQPLATSHFLLMMNWAKQENLIKLYDRIYLYLQIEEGVLEDKRLEELLASDDYDIMLSIIYSDKTSLSFLDVLSKSHSDPEIKGRSLDALAIRRSEETPLS